LIVLIIWECGPKMSPELRKPIETAVTIALVAMIDSVSKLFSEQRARDVYTSSMQAGILAHEDISLACGWSVASFFIGYIYPGALTTANECGLFSTALDLYRRVEPSSLPGEWWSSTCDVVDVTSARLVALWVCTFATIKRLPSPTQSSWWSELLDHAIRMSKLNASEGLSGRDTMAHHMITHWLSVVEVAAQNESEHETLLASGVTDALEYAIVHDHVYLDISLAAYASGAAVALVGRNEGGKVLRAEAVHAVLDRLHMYFRPGSHSLLVPPKTIMANLGRLTIMVVSDANK